MQISNKTNNIISELTLFSGSKIKNPLELSYLIELADISQKDKLFYDIQFTAKYLNGLTKILQSNITALPAKNGKAGSSEEAREKIMGEYKKNILKFQAYLKDLLIEADESTRAEIEEKYLSLSRTSMVNLTSLVYDLSWLKKYYNSKRT